MHSQHDSRNGRSPASRTGLAIAPSGPMGGGGWGPGGGNFMSVGSLMSSPRHGEPRPSLAASAAGAAIAAGLFVRAHNPCHSIVDDCDT